MVSEYDTSEKITIQLSVYHEMLERITWLGHLEAAGVDNWEGYEAAQDLAEG